PGPVAGLERAAGVPVEPVLFELVAVEREDERAAACVAHIAELLGERGPQSRRRPCERCEARRLRIGREHACGCAARPTPRLRALEHADAEPALLRAPGARETDDPAPDDDGVEPFHGADDRLRRRGRYASPCASCALPA